MCQGPSPLPMPLCHAGFDWQVSVPSILPMEMQGVCVDAGLSAGAKDLYISNVLLPVEKLDNNQEVKVSTWL